MQLRELVARIFGGAQPSASPQEAALRQILNEAEALRRARQPEQALARYREGLEQARAEGLTHVQEVFLGQMGALYTEWGKFDEAEAAFQEALELAKRAEAPFRQARALLNLGAYHLKRGALEAAQKFLEEALSLGRRANDTATVNLALGNLADVYLRQGNAGYALRLLKEILPQAMQSPQQAAYILGRTGQTHLHVGEADRGRKLLAQAIRMAEQQNQPDQELMWSCVLADHLYREGQYAESLAFWARVEELKERVLTLPHEYDPLTSLSQRASAHLRLGHYADAEKLARAALESARAAGDLAAEVNALMILGNVQRAQRNYAAAIETLQRAIDLQPEATSAERVRAMITLGSLYQEQGDNERAFALFEEALTLASADPDHREGRAAALRQIGALLHKQGNNQAALEKWTEALSIFEASGDHAQAARTLCDIAAVRRALSGITAAMPDYERATVLLNHVRDAATRGFVLSNVATLYTDLGEAETAKSFYEQALKIARESGNRRAESVRLGNYGWFHVMTGQPREGAAMLESALAISRELGDPLLIAVQLSNLAQAHHELGDLQKAEQLYRQALSTIEADDLESKRWRAVFQSNLARTLTAQRRYAEARTLLEAALPVSRELGDQEAVARALVRLGEIHLAEGDSAEAEKLAREAEILSRKLGYRKGQADALWLRARLASESDRVNLLNEAKRLYTILRDPMVNSVARLLGE
jgi:tetratricopeptide (TPR) repeat protein